MPREPPAWIKPKSTLTGEFSSQAQPWAGLNSLQTPLFWSPLVEDSHRVVVAALSMGGHHAKRNCCAGKLIVASATEMGRK